MGYEIICELQEPHDAHDLAPMGETPVRCLGNRSPTFTGVTGTFTGSVEKSEHILTVNVTGDETCPELWLWCETCQKGMAVSVGITFLDLIGYQVDHDRAHNYTRLITHSRLVSYDGSNSEGFYVDSVQTIGSLKFKERPVDG